MDPLTTAVVVGPNPLAYSTIVSPGFAGVVSFGNKVVGPIKAPPTCIAARYGPPLNTKNDGEIVCASAVKLVLTAPLLVTTTCTDPDMASGGVRILICVGLM